MSGKTNLSELLKGMTPKLNKGEYVFCTIKDSSLLDRKKVICEFTEAEGITIITTKGYADKQEFTYSFIASWITLTIHSSLEAVGLTAAFSSELTKHNISCNVIAAYYHDHIFVDKKDAAKAIMVLEELSKKQE
ncbi:ACT domain-containing protein [Cellulophaga omnivescoria]|uniref:ACT domain-containing protein n=1 Tax=Cellulophaga omnivescoria TaxID=1888890 RepID=UPI0009859453|nr:ACT domain-containing protein [Cellulophaga omnivescoria]WKB80438.1 ACT domain-containing protein [Cellulophaga lytica]